MIRITSKSIDSEERFTLFTYGISFSTEDIFNVTKTVANWILTLKASLTLKVQR